VDDLLTKKDKKEFIEFDPPCYDLDLSRLSDVSIWNVSPLEDGIISRSSQTLVLVQSLESIEKIKDNIYSGGHDTFAKDIARHLKSEDLNPDCTNASIMLRLELVYFLINAEIPLCSILMILNRS
jgi:hypothetical protein